ncbi:uncharacterized protein LOC111705337 isoform X2 [Eurytemora carolleeae]|nr:uncharacterized protein LOC111705337 isoform X2 [Eurytemora carolleeae]|eukprot:XP_023333604.1 uncharacterized protein LOC111705337 isoform X2 [Eurytemora affinis]
MHPGLFRCNNNPGGGGGGPSFSPNSDSSSSSDHSLGGYTAYSYSNQDLRVSNLNMDISSSSMDSRMSNPHLDARISNLHLETRISNLDTRLNPAPENTRFNQYGLTRMRSQNLPAGAHRGVGGEGVCNRAWQQHQILNIQENYPNKGLMDLSHEELRSPGDDFCDLEERMLLQQLEMTHEQLITMPVRELNKIIKAKGLPREQVTNLKSKRRTKKNRGYAANCRFKRDKLQKELEDELRTTTTKLEHEQKVVAELERECTETRKCLTALQRLVQ